MRKILPLLLALLLAILVPAAGITEEQQKAHLPDWDICETPAGLLACADLALADGMDPQQVLDEMSYYAEEGGFLDQFQRACENLAAYENETYQRLRGIIDKEDLELNIVTSAAEDGANGWDAYGFPKVSDALKALLSDSGAQYCLRPACWPEDQFQAAFGTSYAKFKPSRPQAGYVCIVIKSSAQCEPEVKWNQGDNYDFFSTLVRSAESLASRMEGDAPILTGNPQLASTFWVFDVSYPFYALYGSDGAIRGFHCEASLTVVDTVTRAVIAQSKEKNILPDRISSWRNGKADPGIPFLPRTDSFNTLVTKTVSAIRKERSAAVANRKITALNVAKILDGVLLEQTAKLSDAWQIAIYESGARDVQLEGNTVTFSLRSFDPGTGKLGKYPKAEDPTGWLDEALSNAREYNLRQTLTVENGQFTAKSLTQLKKAVQKAAETAKKAFGAADMAAALKGRLFPAPIDGKVTKGAQLLVPSGTFRNTLDLLGGVLPEGSAEAFAALYYAQKSQKLTVKGGPHAMKLACVGVSPKDLLSSAGTAALDTLAFAPADDRDLDQLDQLLDEKLAEKAVSLLKNAKYKYTLTVDIDDLAQGVYPVEYREYLNAYQYLQAIDSLDRSAGMLPEEKALAMPASGKLSGGASGTQVKLKITKNSNATYIQMRSESSGKTVASAFIQPGKTVTVKVPSGSYRLYYCSGPYWYGEGKMFASLGSYNKSEPVEIKSKKYVHTFTLENVQNGDVSVYNADPDEFLQN